MSEDKIGEAADEVLKRSQEVVEQSFRDIPKTEGTSSNPKVPADKLKSD